LASSQLIAIAIAGVLLIGMRVWLRVQKSRAARADVRLESGTEQDWTVEKDGFRRRGRPKLPDDKKQAVKPDIRSL
jgi:hypothetical protein